jgi:exodeoxyribonuclease VII large subunit
MHVRLRAQVSLYPARGDFQLIVEHMEEAGEGALRRAYEERKRALAAEGLFNEADKRALPALPRRIGVVTSATGAAVRDVLTTLRRRFPAVPVVVYPVPVQGEAAAPAIAHALATAGQRAEADVIILARGGGSLEDLWAFNEPEVVRAIRACPLPVVSGVGHEVDVTLADLAADLRAPTPTGAAEQVVPDAGAYLQRLHRDRDRLTRATQRRLRDLQQRVDHDRRRLIHPGRRLAELRRRTEAARDRLLRALMARLEGRRQQLAAISRRLERATPRRRIAAHRERTDEARRRLLRAMVREGARRRDRLAAVSRQLESVSPLATLGRGYAIARGPDGGILRRAEESAPGEPVEVQLASGRLEARVEAVHPAPASSGDTDT